MLTLVKLKKISKYDEKVWNAHKRLDTQSRLNDRRLLIYLGILYGDEESRCKKMPVLAFATAALILINGQYYSQVVVETRFEQYSVTTLEQIA